MNKKMKALSIAGLLLVWMVGLATAQGTSEATSIICSVLASVRTVLFIIAGGIGVVVITLQGIKWAASADDPGARKQAKEGIIHAIVGLIIVLAAIAIVSMVFSGGCSM
jgi:hypothetical protein